MFEAGPCVRVQADLGVAADREQLFLPSGPIFQPPQLAASRRDLKIKPLSVRDLIGFVRRFEGTNADIRESDVGGISLG
jgi:hypothetical protein